ncbi:transcription factor bZIP [Marssonina coronariae]|uniref:Transcription factor bZIP n=1 Tax=Diplocarpon coronariae TaxID=2795749 RepID=A0A218Z8N7_9HELO|nr:transcription factor bZIP [Marssonina coronariae]
MASRVFSASQMHLGIRSELVCPPGEIEEYGEHEIIIPSQLNHHHLHSTIFPLQENLSSNAASSFPFTIPDFNTLSNTDSNPRWPSSSSSSLPANSTLQPFQDLSHTEPQQPQHQDFVLFERSPSLRSTPSLFNTQAITGQHRRHSSNIASASSLQNQRVAAIIQATGHSINTSALTIRFNPAQSPQQFYASSAPSSTTTLQPQHQTRPQVPLFSETTGHTPQKPNMVMQDVDLFEEFTALEGGASTQNSLPSAYSSPAVPILYDPEMNISASSSSNMGTVSPRDLHRDPFGSVPASTAFTNLTSPDSPYNQSPEFTGYEVSPFVGDNPDLDQALVGDPWYPLFPQDDQVEHQAPASQSPLLPEEELEVSEHLRRRRSGTASSPPAGGIRKRDKPLPPIVVEDPNDTIAMKRARNTLAARKSRQRKMQRFEELEDEIAKLKAERDHWKSLALRRNGPSGINQG